MTLEEDCDCKCRDCRDDKNDHQESGECGHTLDHYVIAGYYGIPRKIHCGRYRVDDVFGDIGVTFWFFERFYLCEIESRRRLISNPVSWIGRVCVQCLQGFCEAAIVEHQ